MCGIFGVINSDNSALAASNVKKLTNRLFDLSESRGKEASGLTILPSTHSSSLFVVKSPAPASTLKTDRRYSDFFNNALDSNNSRLAGVIFGHTRLVTNGSQLDDSNNQPVVCNGAVGVHNGIIVNVDALWSKHSDLTKKSDVDTEILLALLRKYYRQSHSPVNSVRKVFSEIKGAASIAVTFSDLNAVLLATNNGSLYFADGGTNRPLYFASERFTLSELLKSSMGVDFSGYTIKQLLANQGILVDLNNDNRLFFNFNAADHEFTFEPLKVEKEIKVVTIGKSSGAHSVFDVKKISVPTNFQKEFERVEHAVDSLVRCKTCVLPETVPFIQFNASGVCNFCTNYKKITLRGLPALEQALAPYRRAGSEADCVAAMSGGRDSCYGLHYLVKELKMKPVIYTYDWGMVTDLARRNISRMCSALGVEHILISADIPWKRNNIRKNVLGWLRKPHLGMIPLFMAGDKQFVWYANRVKKQTGLELDIFTFNLLEKTQFKEEYTGIQFWKPGEDADKLGEQLGLVKGLKLCGFYGKEFLTNSGYWNSSLIDTFYGFVAYYLMPQTFIPMFHYIEWREDVVTDLLVNQYDWELASDTESSWRIGDGTAPFYNYIYYMVGGFTENDTLRSNQVREGHLSRSEALRLTKRDNKPRWDSIKWYCDIIGIDFETTINIINKIDKTFRS